jgi:hypothetical protein
MGLEGILARNEGDWATLLGASMARLSRAM